jgi:hypothetical protein
MSGHPPGAVNLQTLHIVHVRDCLAKGHQQQCRSRTAMEANIVVFHLKADHLAAQSIR